YRVQENLFRISPTLNWEPSDRFELVFGPELQITDQTSSDTLISIEQPYGSAEFNQLGLVLAFEWDSQISNTDRSSSSRLSLVPPPGEGKISSLSRTGFNIRGEASYFPAILDVAEDFGAFEGVATGYLGLGRRDHFVLAARVGGRAVRGTFPWFEAAFIGGPDSNRGFPRQRFAGEESLYGNFELRIHLLKGVFIFPGRIWMFGLLDAGRVWVDGEDSSDWHPSYGGGFVFELAATPVKLWTGVAKNDDEGDLRFYFNSGFAF
ncbi:MAG: BamA/TamA family outer membrane protein, partial [Acidobacteriota bacterium]